MTTYNHPQLFVISLLLGIIALTTQCQSPQTNTSDTTSLKPNIIYILADDLGYGELGAYGQKIIETPYLDQLAANGMLFTNHYSGSPVCAPSRCVLLTGKHTGHAYIRGNDEWKARGEVWNYQAMFDDPNLEGQRPLPMDSVSIGDLLQAAGYQTAIIGKWGLGGPTTEGIPNNQGFDYFYGYNCQRQAHTLYPKHLWENENKIILDNPMIAPHTKLSNPEQPNDSVQYERFAGQEFAPTLMGHKAVAFIEEHKDEPFFLYFASPLPHVPLQAPKKWVDYYRKKLGDEPPYPGNQGYFPNYTPRATYAAMISYLDEQVGDLIAALKANGCYDNTIIMFSSDNGPTYTGGAQTTYFDSAQPFSSEYGKGKGFVGEGGIRVPFIVSWPGHIQPASVSNEISAFWDILPTVCEIVGIETPPNRDGISLLPAFQGKATPNSHPYLYWEFPSYKGQQAVRMGHWKGIRNHIFEGNKDILLYDLSSDSLELNNVAEAHPDIVAQIRQIMHTARTTPPIERFKFKELGD